MSPKLSDTVIANRCPSGEYLLISFSALGLGYLENSGSLERKNED